MLGGTQQQFNQQNGENREAIEAIAESRGKLLDSTTQLSAAVKGKADATELESLRKDFKALEEKLKGQTPSSTTSARLLLAAMVNQLNIWLIADKAQCVRLRKGK